MRYNFVYHLKILGNTRINFTAHADGKPEVNQVTSYDPFGFITLQSSWYATGSFKNKYLYNGKEFQNDQLGGTGLDWYDYGARFYDPQIGRWMTPDPLSEVNRKWSPYRFAYDNPLRFLDPDGMLEDYYEHKNDNGSTSVIYQEGNASTANINGETYTNAGSTYTQAVDANSSITYTQDKSTEYTATTNTPWISQYSKDNWNGTPADQACGKASDAMLGGKPDKGSIIITNEASNGRAGDANSNSERGINTMKSSIESGKGVKVGYDYKDGSSMNDNMGDHFVVANGFTEKLNNGNATSTSFHYLNPGSRNPESGNSSRNVLTVKNNRLENTVNNIKRIVTNIRLK